MVNRVGLQGRKVPKLSQPVISTVTFLYLHRLDRMMIVYFVEGLLAKAIL